MPIDVSQHRLLTFAELANSLPPRRRGRPMHVGTLHRWRREGLRGVRLEAVRLGGCWMSSHESLAAFVAGVTAAVNAASVGGMTPDVVRPSRPSEEADV